jgi:hypothetical protein
MSDPTPSVQLAAECFCDRTGLGVKGVTCGDCPRDYAQQPAASGVCEDCPPVGYPTDATRCAPCPRGTGQQPAAAGVVERYSVGLVYDDSGNCVQRVGGVPPRAGSVHERFRHVVLASDYDALQAKVARLEAACVEAVGCFDAAHIEGITRCMEDGDMYLVLNIWNRRLSDVRDNLDAALQGAARG